MVNFITFWLSCYLSHFDITLEGEKIYHGSEPVMNKICPLCIQFLDVRTKLVKSLSITSAAGIINAGFLCIRSADQMVFLAVQQ